MQIESFPLSKEDIQQMLDLTYELEGLLHLSVNREESTPSRLMPLMKSKITALSMLMEKSSGTIKEESALSATDDGTSGFSYAIPDDDEEAAVCRTEADMEEETVSDREPEPADESEPEVGAAAEEQIEEGILLPAESAPLAYCQPTPEMPDDADDMATDAPMSVASAPRHKAPLFSINDRFLYSRELFGGKVADFEAALKDVAGMESYEEAEEYFYTEWNLDPESPVAHGFLEVIANYFS